MAEILSMNQRLSPEYVLLWDLKDRAVFSSERWDPFHLRDACTRMALIYHSDHGLCEYHFKFCGHIYRYSDNTGSDQPGKPGSAQKS